MLGTLDMHSFLRLAALTGAAIVLLAAGKAELQNCSGNGCKHLRFKPSPECVRFANRHDRPILITPADWRIKPVVAPPGATTKLRKKVAGHASGNPRGPCAEKLDFSFTATVQ